MTVPRSLYTNLLADRYRLLETLGDGGVVRTFRAWDGLLRRHVMVKLFEPAEDDDASRRIELGVGALARLSHPGLLSVYDSDVHRGARFVVLRLVEGPTLREWVEAGPLSIGLVVRLGAELADALSHVHSHRLVHGEVCSANVLIDDGSACLRDFGLEPPGEEDGRPEVEPDDSEHSLSGATDVYALGVLLLECLTGQVTEPGRRPPEVPEEVPEEFADLLRRMTSLAPRERPSALGVARVLNALPLEVTSPPSAALPPEIVSPRRPGDGESVPRPGTKAAGVEGAEQEQTQAAAVVGAGGTEEVPGEGEVEKSGGEVVAESDGGQEKGRVPWRGVAASMGVLIGALAVTAVTSSVLRPAESTPTGPSSGGPTVAQVSGAATQEEARPALVGVTRSTDAPQPAAPPAAPADSPAPEPSTNPVTTSNPAPTTTAPPATSTSVAPTTATSPSTPAPGTSTSPSGDGSDGGNGDSGEDDQ
ncbi:serine/threonine-protein kinase [Actinosynnema sp. NPDC050436]|uniref:serine/threonine protein kinase n=1 Tax=Actinosynnema sp. NPDC050436 TaxID=3155659 RepID=UPI0033DB953F